MNKETNRFYTCGHNKDENQYSIRATEVEILMYKKLKGNVATRRGHLLENRATKEYRLYQLKQLPDLTVDDGDLFYITGYSLARSYT